MRRIIPIFLSIALSCGPAPARAGPTCETRTGLTVRCEDSRAMPVGRTAPLEVRLNRMASEPPEPTALELGGAFAIVALLFLLIALMPDFDGWGGDDSDREGDGITPRPE